MAFESRQLTHLLWSDRAVSANSNKSLHARKNICLIELPLVWQKSYVLLLTKIEVLHNRIISALLPRYAELPSHKVMIQTIFVAASTASSGEIAEYRSSVSRLLQINTLKSFRLSFHAF